MRTVEPAKRRRLARLIGVAVATAVVGWSLGLAQDRRESEAALTAVRKEIKALQDRIARETWARFGAEIQRCALTEFDAARMRNTLHECWFRCGQC